MAEPFRTYFEQLWVLNRIDETYLSQMVTKGRLTQAEADAIKAIER